VTPPLARLDGIVRRFGHISALDGASLELRAGEVHGVLGENGAGKTTLLSVLGGLLRPDGGSIELDGALVELSSPRVAWTHGIGLVHQHFALVPRLSVLENLALGRRDVGPGWKSPLVTIREQATLLSEQTGLSVPFDVAIEDLSVGDRQRVEILKALLREPRLLLLDEPTAVLAPTEVAQLFALLRRLAEDGRSVVLVAHKLDEILSVADRVTVLRGGRTVLTAVRSEVDSRTLTEAMVGGPRGPEGPPDSTPGFPAGSGDRPERSTVARSVARLAGVNARGAGGGVALHGVDLEVSGGEVVAIAGVEGNGQRELALVLSGRLEATAGVVEIPEDIGLIPQDRSTEGLALDFDLAENMALALHRDPAFRRGVLLRWDAIRVRAAEVRDEFEVQARDVATLAGTLSGGNQQRLVVGRELGRRVDLLVADNPTRGLDVTATAFVREELRRIARDGDCGVVLISADLDEVLDLGDRIFVLVRGRLSPVPPEQHSRDGVGALMLSAKSEEA
jgi:simple sugar transport system ATP-binding protein